MAKPRYTPEQVADALRKCHGLVYRTARLLGCTAQTIRNYRARHPSVEEAAQQKRGEMIDDAELSLHKAIRAGKGWAVCFTLKTLGRSRGYVEASGDDQDPPFYPPQPKPAG